ncbi:type II toxin-antitoxin system PemK/MazF family toxin [Alkalicaulis satelles]|uniref:type II toxin-antitoxin system PemK/MazF family toxin n=1 Tax=Alkalicaulis satelles TaxID=2609175 RepID=UPI0018ED2238|nr:type II toxin-antitoxin system PemK/MazF family toxin [Alkalicaulis satelles]
MSGSGVYEPGDVIWLELDPARGREQAGRRPTVVVSTYRYNAGSSLVLVCPVTSSERPWPFKLALDAEDPVAGYILCDQIRTIDPEARHARRAGQVCADTRLALFQRIAAILDLPDPTRPA